MSATLPFEFPLLDWFQTIHTVPLDYLMIGVSTLFNSGIFGILLALLLFSMPSHRRAGTVLSLSLILMLIICNLVLKKIINRARPYEMHPWLLDTLLTIVPSDSSFPSGHTCCSFTCATVLLLDRRYRLGVMMSMLAVLVGISRMYLYMHFPTDVAAGLVLGILVGFLGTFIYKSLAKKFPKFARATADKI